MISPVCVRELYMRISEIDTVPTIVVADYPRIIRVPLTFFGEGCNTVTGTWRGVGMDGGSWVCSFTGNRNNFDSRFEGNSSRCCIEWFCLVFLDAILLTDKSALYNICNNLIISYTYRDLQQHCCKVAILWQYCNVAIMKLKKMYYLNKYIF